MKEKAVIVGYQSKATGFVYDFIESSFADITYLYDPNEPDEEPLRVPNYLLAKLYNPVIEGTGNVLPQPAPKKESIWESIKRILSGRWD